MDLDNDSQPFETDSQTFAGLAPLEKYSDHDLSESEDEGLSSLQDHSYSNLLIPESMKNILSMDTSRDMSNTQDDSESDDDSLYKANISQLVDIEQLNANLKKHKNKFVNFPLLPDEEQEKESDKPTKKTKKPREKKKRRDKGKKPDVDIYELEERARNKSLSKVFEKFADEQSDSDEEKGKKSKKSKKKGGRKTRKAVSNENMVDENGERLVRTTEFLSTTDESSEDERALSKREELEMTKEQERLRRSADARLKPAIVVKSYDEFVKRREQRELDLLSSLEATSQREIEQLIQEQALKTKQEQLNQSMKNGKRPLALEDSDDDLIIENDPNQIAAAAMLSPERSRIPIASHFSPQKSPGLNIRNYNKSILSRITSEGYAYRMKMEQSAKARGKFTSATERAKRLLEQEKNARMIHSQVQSHFERYGNNNEDDEEEDEDYQEDGDVEQEQEEEDEDEDNEFVLDQFTASTTHKRKNSISDVDSEQEDDMSTSFAKRWKGKKSKKSIFDDSDDEDEVAVKKPAPKPVPAHSISNFFKAKETEIAKEEPEEDKPLGRLKRRIIQPDVDDDEDAMDIDEPIIVKRRPRSPKPISLGPKEKNEYFEEEAEEEEDEFFGAGGEDIDDGENLDEFEKDDLLVEDNNDEHIDEAALRDVFNKQDAESDNNFIKRLLTDVTGGGLRKQKAAAEAGLMIDDIDIYDDEDNDLIAIRLAAAARRRKLLKKKGGDPLENLMSDPKTAAFAKAGQAVPADASAAFLSDSDIEDEVEDTAVRSENRKVKLVIQDDDEEEEEDDDMDILADEDQLVVSDFNPMESPLRDTITPSRFTRSPIRSPMRNTALPAKQHVNTFLASPLRGGLVSSSSSAITSADDAEDDEIQVEALTNSSSPLNNHKNRMFNTPVHMERFKRLISETNGSNLDAPRVGFGSLSRSQTQEGDEGEKVENTRGSIGGFLTSKKDKAENKKSRLSALTKKKSSAFTYAE